MSHYYCFPDIHGDFLLLRKALNFVYQANPDGGKIVFLGDYIDRGQANKEVLETVMNPPKNWEFVCLMGNHEQMFIQAYLNRTQFFDDDVLGEYLDPNVSLITYELLHDSFPVEIVEWMMKLKKFHFEGNNIFAHAWYDDDLSPESQEDDTLLWQRASDWESFRSKSGRLHLTHGHTPRKHGPVSSPNRTNLDCGAVFYGRYVIGKYKDGVEGPIDFHEFKRF